jgi:hypothetical protein
MTSLPHYWLHALRTSVAALLLALGACGGGVETGGTGPTGSAFVEGPVTGFGSIIVQGVRFDESNAPVEDADGVGIARDALRLGMVVEVEGSRPIDDGSGGRNAVATRVRLASDLLGPVQAVGLTDTRIRVLGQIVRIAPATLLENLPGGIGSLQVNDIVEVHGFVSPAGLLSDYVATRVQRRTLAPGAFRVRGVARNVDTTARTIRVGLETFDLTTTGLPAGLVDGSSVVRMTVDTAAVNGRWPVRAAIVERRNEPDRDVAEVEGLITSFTSATQFAVNGFTVDASAASPPSGLAVGVRVEVKGRISAGTLVASSVALRSDVDVFNEGLDVRDLIANLDTNAKTFSVRGVTVFYGSVPPPQFDKGTEATLANGVRVRVRAVLAPDRTQVIATRIEFVNN